MQQTDSTIGANYHCDVWDFSRFYTIIDIGDILRIHLLDSMDNFAGFEIDVGENIFDPIHFKAELDLGHCVDCGLQQNFPLELSTWIRDFAPRIRFKGTIIDIDTTEYRIYNKATFKYLHRDSLMKVEIYKRQNSSSATKSEHYFDGFYKVKQSRLYTSTSTFDSTSIKYNYLELKAQTKDGNGNIVKIGYDDLLNQDSIANIDTSYTLVSDSYQTDVGNYFGTVYGFINKKVFKDEQGNKFEKYFDAVGNLRREVKFLDSSQIDAPMVDLTTDYRYDSAYRVSKVKTPQEKIIHYYYDGYGRQTKRITVDAGQTDFYYDKNDNLIFSQDANQRNSPEEGDKYTFRNYDGLNRMTGTGEVIYEIDSPNDGIQYEDDTATYYLTVNVYDTLTNSVVNSLFSAPSGYDSESNFTQGNLVATAYRTRSTDNWNFKYYKYDLRGRVIKMWSIIVGLGTKVIRYSYNSQNQVTRIDYNGVDDYKRFRYIYDAAGRLSSVDHYVDTSQTSDLPQYYTNLASYTYNANSQIEKLSFADEEIENNYSYNSRNWISDVSSKNDIFVYTNTYFKNGNVKTQSLSGSYNDDFTFTNDLTFINAYDKSNRLISSQVSHSYKILNTYDKDGNLLTLKRYNATPSLEDDFAYTYYSGTNKLRKVSGSNDQYTYDYNGNMIVDNVNMNISIQYDHRNLITQLRQIQDDLLFETKYYYDEAGNRMRKKVYQYTGYFDAEIQPIFDENSIYWNLVKDEVYVRGVDGNDLAIYEGGTLSQWNIFGLSNEGKIDSEGDLFFYLKDHLGSVRAIVSEENKLKSAQDYDAWGYLLTGRSNNSEDSKYKFTEKERDDESKYDYFGARYYDSRIGRWGQVEPRYDEYIQFSPYNYSLSNPISLKDFDGNIVILSQEDQKFLGEVLTIAVNNINPEYSNLVQNLIDIQNLTQVITYFNPEANQKNLYAVTGRIDYNQFGVSDAIGIALNPGDFFTTENKYLAALLLEHELYHFNYYTQILGFTRGSQIDNWYNKNKILFHKHEIEAINHSLKKLRELYKQGKVSRGEYRDSKKRLRNYKKEQEDMIKDLEDQ